MAFPEYPTLVPRLDGLRVLVVVDDTETLDLVRLQLHLYGPDVVTASSAAVAFASLVEEPPHVLISDISMPDEDGYSLLRRIRAQDGERGGRTPALAYSADIDLSHLFRTRAAGFQAQLAKPVALEDLVTTVAHLAGRAA